MPSFGGAVVTAVPGAGVGLTGSVGASSQWPLDAWRQMVGYHPFHFWQQSSQYVPLPSGGCNQLVHEYPYQQASRVSRHDVRRAIASAEGRLFDYLNFRVGDVYLEKEILFPRPHDRRMRYGRPMNSSGRWLAVDVGEGYIRECGILALTHIDSPGITYQDSTGDSIKDQFVATVDVSALGVSNPEEIAIYFTAGDRNNDAIADSWRIRPVQVSISGGVATITGPAWLLVKPTTYLRLDSYSLSPGYAAADPSPSSLFAASIDVYWRRTDGNGQSQATATAVLIWESEPPPFASTGLDLACCPGLSYDTSEYDPAGLAYAVARAQVRDKRRGTIYMGEATLDTNNQWIRRNWSGCRQPDRVLLRYRAGATILEADNSLPHGSNWTNTLFALSCAELEGCFCEESRSNQILAHWQQDLAKIPNASDREFYRMSDADLNNPFGTRRGHIYAWQQVKNKRLAQPVLA